MRLIRGSEVLDLVSLEPDLYHDTIRPLRYTSRWLVADSTVSLVVGYAVLRTFRFRERVSTDMTAP